MDFEKELSDAADGVVMARHLLEAGGIGRVAQVAADAIEAVLTCLLPLPFRLRGPKSTARDRYSYRYREAQKQLSLSEHDLWRLHNLRLVDRFHERAAGGSRVLLTEDEALWCVETASDLLTALLTSTRVSSDVAGRVAERLMQQNLPSPEQELLEIVERSVGWGQYDAALEGRLERLSRRFSTLGSKRGERHYALVLTLRAHMAMNRGLVGGASGALALSRRPLGLWERFGERSRTIHVLKIQSIALRMRRRLDEADRLMDRATAVAGDSASLIEDVELERSAILLARGDPRSAYAILKPICDRANAGGPPVAEGERLQKLARAAMRMGRFAEAEAMLHRGRSLIPSDYLVAHAVGGNIFTELYARWGKGEQSRHCAEAVERIAMERGFRHQLQVLRHTRRIYQEIW